MEKNEDALNKKEVTEIKDPNILLSKIRGIKYKNKKTNKNGIPDLVAIPPNTPVIFSEIKTPTGKTSAIQDYRLRELQKFGFKTEIYNGQEEENR